MENFHGAKMTDEEFEFLEDQRNERKMYCESFVDKKWNKVMERRRHDLQALEKMANKAETGRTRTEAVGHNNDIFSDDQNLTETHSDHSDKQVPIQISHLHLLPSAGNLNLSNSHLTRTTC